VAATALAGHALQRRFEALQLPPTQRIELGAYRAYGMVWAATSGCYALQIDGMTFRS